MPVAIQIRNISAANTHALRHRILRKNQPLDACAYSGDDHPQTVHFGVYADGRLTGIASLYKESPEGESGDEAWRLRGMATGEQMRGQGLGKALLRACLDHASANNGTLVWCNARSPAAGFYEREGFSVEGDEFDIPGIGPHYRMKRRLDLTTEGQ